jgi:hypothetical protein
MAKVHVFAIDWVPAKTDIASGGGLRSRQIIDALRDGGHDVTVSVPAEARHLRRLKRHDMEPDNVRIHTADNQLDVLRKARADVVMWLAPLSRRIPYTRSNETIHVCDLIGLPHIEAAMGAPARETPMRERIGALCGSADLVLTGSDEQHGYWLAELSRDRAAPSTAIVPYATPEALRGKPVSGQSRLLRLHVVGMAYAWSTSISLLDRVSAWVSRQHGITLSLIIGTDPGGATDRSAMERLHAIACRPNVLFQGEVSFGEAMEDCQAGSFALDLYETNMERRMAVPIRSVNALTHGVPLLSTIDGPFMRRVAAFGAGIIAADTADQPLEATLDKLAAMSAIDLSRMSKAARRFAAAEFAYKQSVDTLVAAVADAIDRKATPVMTSRVADPAPPHILVVTDVEAHHRELRVDIPMNALLGTGAIAGYSVWSRGQYQFTTSADIAKQNFDVLWVQRAITPELTIALQILGRPFVYDIDDNLLSAPTYRPPFPIEMTQSVNNLLRACAVLSCSTARLAQLLHTNCSVPLVDKSIVTPNLLRDRPAPRPVGTPRCLIWVSSDTPALTVSRLNVQRAIRDFCLSHDLQLISIGADPPDLIRASDIKVLHVRQAPYGSYLSVLRSFAPGIMVCPLETDGDAPTTQFISGKSDIKMLEVAAGGHIGVFSRAAPYVESDLPRPILCENSYAAWMEALAEAWLRCGQSPEEPPIPADRCADLGGVAPWLRAVHRGRMPGQLSSAEFYHAITALRGRYAKRLLSREEFDATFYIKENADVQHALDVGILPSAYDHYRTDGFREGRSGRRDDQPAPHNESAWANLLNTLGDLKASVQEQETRVEALKAQRATRLALKRSFAG